MMTTQYEIKRGFQVYSPDNSNTWLYRLCYYKTQNGDTIDIEPGGYWIGPVGSREEANAEGKKLLEEATE